MFERCSALGRFDHHPPACPSSPPCLSYIDHSVGNSDFEIPRFLKWGTRPFVEPSTYKADASEGPVRYKKGVAIEC